MQTTKVVKNVAWYPGARIMFVKHHLVQPGGLNINTQYLPVFGGNYNAAYQIVRDCVKQGWHAQCLTSGTSQAKTRIYTGTPPQGVTAPKTPFKSGWGPQGQTGQNVTASN